MQLTKLLRSEPHSKPISRRLGGRAVVDQFQITQHAYLWPDISEADSNDPYQLKPNLLRNPQATTHLINRIRVALVSSLPDSFRYLVIHPERHC